MVLKILAICMAFFLSLPLPAFAQNKTNFRSDVIITSTNLTADKTSCMDKAEVSFIGSTDFSAGDLGDQEAECSGPICFCTGPANSADCKKLTACIDDIECVGDRCGCIGGKVEE